MIDHAIEQPIFDVSFRIHTMLPQLATYGVCESDLFGIAMGDRKDQRALDNLDRLLAYAGGDDAIVRDASISLIRHLRNTAREGGAGDFNNLAEIPSYYFERQQGQVPLFVPLLARAGVSIFERYGHMDFAGLPAMTNVINKDPSTFSNVLYPRLADRDTPLTFLDAGCGQGKAIEDVIKLHPNANVVGIDIIPYANWTAITDQSPHTVLVAGDIFRPPFADNMFDVVYSYNTIMYPPDKFAFMISLLHKVKPGGLVYFQFASDSHIPGEQYYFTPSLTTLLAQANLLDVIQVHKPQALDAPHTILLEKISQFPKHITSPPLVRTERIQKEYAFATRSIY